MSDGMEWGGEGEGEGGEDCASIVFGHLVILHQWCSEFAMSTVTSLRHVRASILILQAFVHCWLCWHVCITHAD